ITATATRGLEAGAKATNQAVVLAAFWAMSAVLTSSAVPVLPATWMPGIAAARPVPPLTTAIIMSRTWPATLALTTRLRGFRPPATQGLMRTPRLAIVCATDAIPSGVALSLFWPIADAPTARLSLSSDAFGIVLTFAAGRSGVSLKPNFSAIATRRFAPTLAPIGAKTLLQECANEVVRLPPHCSSDALRSLTPDSVAYWRTG